MPLKAESTTVKTCTTPTNLIDDLAGAVHDKVIERLEENPSMTVLSAIVGGVSLTIAMNQYHAWLGNRRFAKMEEKSEQRHWKYQQAANAKWEEIKKRLDEFQLKAQEDQQVTRSRLREFRLNNQEIQQGTRAKVDEFQLELQSCRLANKELRFSVEKLKAHLFDYKLPSHRAEISCKQVLQKGDLSSPQGLPPSIESAEIEKESVAAMEPTGSVPVACETWSSPNAASMRRIQGAKTLVTMSRRFIK